MPKMREVSPFVAARLRCGVKQQHEPKRPSPRQEWGGDPDIVAPPSTVHVPEPRIVLYQADGTPLKRNIGYRP